MTANAQNATAEPAANSGKTKKIGIVVLAIAVLAAGAWYFLLKPEGKVEPKPGEVVQLESIQVNLASGHYLRLGLALQLTETAHEADGSKALDAAIGVFSGRPVGEVNKPEMREELRAELNKELEHRYHGDVMEVYFTEFVTQ
ncbi:flagellar basal body-associated FliL family protein [Nocardioides sp. WS12]|uniref:flagellar basal body-associated FliL family protein n=1 Tax=Nocardioides sp. WS12 TaxID=2486272 RepID=UPI001F3BD94D|nr:flagellar basal body-associated FliL family protein [Nocardioides sp. WS12]